MTVPDSPVRSFAASAAALLMCGEAPAALEVCRQGVRAHPGYLTGYYILGQCYEALGQYADAAIEYRRIAGRVPGSDVVQRTLRRIEGAEREAYDAFVARRQETLTVQPNAQPFEAYAAAYQPPAESTVEFLLQRVEQVKQTAPAEPPPREEPEQEAAPGTGKFVTPTLAEIYASQGEYEEAIRAYRTLIRLRASDAPSFEKRIGELEALARSREAT